MPTRANSAEKVARLIFQRPSSTTAAPRWLGMYCEGPSHVENQTDASVALKKVTPST